MQLWWRFVQLGFHLLYNQLAWTYDVVAWVVSLGEWSKWRRAAIPYVRGNRVLELAHGTGHLLDALEDAGFEVIGMDFSPFMGGIAQQRSGVALVQGSGMALPFQDGIFDSVVVTFPTIFILEAETLVGLRRVLANDGRVVIVPEGRLAGSGLIEKVIGWAFAVTGQGGGDGVLGAWRERFEAFGFAVMVERVRLERSWVTVFVADVKDEKHE